MRNEFISEELIQKLKKEQNNLRQKVTITELDISKINIIAGVDVSYFEDKALGVVVVLNKDLELIDVVYSVDKVTFPYIPGFLAFREAPIIFKCFEKLREKNIVPDIVLFDGHGIAHPRGLGIASHIGVLLNIPTIGVAKRKLYGKCVEPKRVGQSTPLFDEEGKIIGYCYLPKKNSHPIYISPGHLSSPETSLEFVKSLIKKHKLPEPTRLAHYYTQKLKENKNI